MKKQLQELEQILVQAYEGETTLAEAERLAARFLVAQMQISGVLRKASLDARMRKTGTKALRAAVYLEIVQKADKKPSEAQISATVDSEGLITTEQNAYDAAEVEAENLKRYYDIFTNAHIYMRSLARGSFGS